MKTIVAYPETPHVTAPVLDDAGNAKLSIEIVPASVTETVFPEVV